MKIFSVGIALLGLMTASCHEQTNGAQVREAVLSEGQTVEAMNKNGKIRISYHSPIKRKYEWDDQQRILRLRVRLEPFQGKFGIYEPGDTWGLFPIGTRLVVEEAVRRFENEEQIKAALAESASYMDWVYTNDGLVVGFGRTPTRRQINVDLWQLLLQGKRPSRLFGARPDRIVVKTFH